MTHHSNPDRDVVYLTRHRGGWAVNYVATSGAGWQSTRLYARAEAQAAGEVLADYLSVALEVGGAA